MSWGRGAQHPWIPPSPPPCHTQTHEGLGGGRALRKAGRVHCCSGAGEGRQGRGEAPGGVGSSGPAQAEGTVCARVPRAEMPGTSGPQARAQGASRASRCPAPAAAVMTENSDKVPIALVGPDDVEFCSPPVSTARGPPGLRGPGLRRPGSTICTELGRWEPIRAPRCGLGVAPHAGAGAEAGASPDAREEDGGQGARRGRRGGKTWQTRGAATLNREESAQRPSRPEDQGPAARGARRNGAPAGARGAVPHSHPRPDAAVAARSLDASSPGRPQAYAAVTVQPSSPARLLKVGAVVLISGAVLLLLGAIGAFYFWKGSDNHVSPEAHGAAGAPGSLACPPARGPQQMLSPRGPPGHLGPFFHPTPRRGFPLTGNFAEKPVWASKAV